MGVKGSHGTFLVHLYLLVAHVVWWPGGLHRTTRAPGPGGVRALSYAAMERTPQHVLRRQGELCVQSTKRTRIGLFPFTPNDMTNRVS